jgi:hypothetical protein
VYGISWVSRLAEEYCLAESADALTLEIGAMTFEETEKLFDQEKHLKELSKDMIGNEVSKILGVVDSPILKEIQELHELVSPAQHIMKEYFLKELKDVNALTRRPSDYMPPIESFVDPNLASEFHKRLQKMIEDFDRSLDKDYDVGVQLVSFGQALIFRLDNIGYWNPSLISFSGSTTDSNAPVKLIQHVSQISVLLMRLKRSDPEAPKRPIGFRGWDEEKPNEA